MRGPPDAFEKLQRQPAESLDEWAARLCEMLSYRLRPITDFSRNLPELTQSPEVLLDLIALHRLLRVEEGESPTAEEYITDFPEFADRIREQFAIEEAVDQLDSDPLGPYAPGEANDEAPQLPSRFPFVRWINKGGYGRVCECIDTRHAGRRIAVKMLHEFRNTTDDAERFRREGELIAQMNHPNLCTLYEFDLDHHPPFLVFELIDGQTVRERLESGPLPEREAVRIARDVAAALAHCHRQGVIHRDLKPENIQVRSDGVVKVLDLGLARRLHGGEGIWNSDERKLMGTIPYFSPEHFVGEADAPADQFSLGIVLYEMLSGRRPFPGKTALELQTAITQSDPTPLPRLDPRLMKILRTMLAKSPQDRFPSMLRVQGELDQYLMTLSPDSTHRRMGTIGLLTITVMLVGMIAAWQLIPEKPTPSTSMAAKEVSRPLELSGILERIATDLSLLPDQHNYRYFRLDTVEETRRSELRDRLAELLRGLSSSGEDIPLVPVSPDGSLVRMDLRSLDWRSDVHWHRLVQKYHLSMRYAAAGLSPTGSTIQLLLKSDLTPFLLADWFVASASAEPLLSELTSTEAASRIRENERFRDFQQAYANELIDLNVAAKELGLSSPYPLLNRLQSNPALAQRMSLSPWLENLPISRRVWNRVEIGINPAAELATELKLGIRRIVTDR